MSNGISDREKYNYRRKQQVEARKLEVIDTAQELFLEKGLANITMNDIMLAAGLNKATMYRYFPSIHPIVFQVEHRMMRNIFSDVNKLELDGLDIKDMVKKILNRLIDKFTERMKEYEYINMFNSLYGHEYPDTELLNEYIRFIKKLFEEKISLKIANIKEGSKRALYKKTIVNCNLIFVYLQTLATRADIYKGTQLISIEEHLIQLHQVVNQIF